MIKNVLIIVLTVLLGITSYIIYTDRHIVINASNPGDAGQIAGPDTPHTDSSAPDDMSDPGIAPSAETVELTEPDIQQSVQVIDSGFEPDIYLDPTIGLTISQDQEIVSSYRVIGPHKFSLLTDSEVPMVVIDLDTGRIKLNPEYDLDEASIQFWKALGKNYPEVCFTREDR